MNNLIQSLASNRLKLRVPETDLKRLLSTVKEGRGHDTKLADTFYDSLEGVLLDLRTVTADNRDAEAFLKPVSRVDYPDYCDFIQTPMDLQTMLKKVKQKQYKSKREFADDLHLIWDNCFKYNNGENHPLRLCAARLREKANRLLSAITDRRDRIEPPVPFPPTSRTASPKPNGIVHMNGRGHSRQRSSHSIAKSKLAIDSSAKAATPSPAPAPTSKTSIQFPDLPAYERTAEGMAAFMDLDHKLDRMFLQEGPREGEAGPSRLPPPPPPPPPPTSNGYLPYGHVMANGFGVRPPSLNVVDRLVAYVDGVVSEDEHSGEMVNGVVGEKRKMVNGDSRPRKRPRHTYRSDRRNDESYHLDLWWEATRSQGLMANGLPALTYSSSDACEAAHQPPSISPHQQPLSSYSTVKSRSKRRKKKKPPETDTSRSLLTLINNNILTQRRIRRTHGKFLALNLNNEDNSGTGQDAMDISASVGLDEEDTTADVQIDERPWRTRGTGLEVGEQDSSDCLTWASQKIIEHAGFQSASKSALDVFTGVMAEYLLNVGRSIRYLCDKYSNTMNPEEIVLHTLFESGITHVRDLERYITDDVIRYGSRLTELEKKLVGAYREVTAVDAIDDEALFANEDDEEEDSEFVMGNFADAFGEDFLGLRELGIAGEFGLQSLSVPKKLLRGKKGGLARTQDRAKPAEPPPPYPPPPPFVPLVSTSVEGQIGLLKPYYIQRFNTFATSQSQPHPQPFIPQPQAPPRPPSPISQEDPSLERQLMSELGLSQSQMSNSKDGFGFPDAMGFGTFSLSAPSPVPAPGSLSRGHQPALSNPPTVLNPSAPPLSLPDDAPIIARTKIGPLGQIVKPNPVTASSAKKKAKGPGPNNSQSGAGPSLEFGQAGGHYPGAVSAPTPGFVPNASPLPPGVTSLPGPAPYYQGVITPSFSAGSTSMGGAPSEAGSQVVAGEGKKKNSKKKSEAPMPLVILANA